MSHDAYAPCLCGSGKKLKFCCQELVGDIEKIERMVQAKQNRQALQALETIDAAHPGNPWIAINRAMVLINEENRLEEAITVLAALLKQFPEHHQATAILANASFAEYGFEQARSAIHHAFLRSSAQHPKVVGNLALGIAAAMYSGHKYMAARQHLTLAMRIVPDDAKQDIFVRLLEFDGNRQLPFPLRSVHELKKVDDLADELQAEVQKARQLSDRGCYRPAAKIFAKLAEQQPNNSALLINTGLCYAWDGEELLAANYLHDAAKNIDDIPTAIEYETLAQLLDYNTTDDIISFSSQEFSINSVSQLLTRLDGEKSFIRIHFPVSPEQEDEAPAAMYHFVDHPERTEPTDEPLTIDNIANVLGQIVIYDGEPGNPESTAAAFVTGEEGERLETTCSAFTQAVGDCVIDSEIDDDIPDEAIPRELSQLTWRWHLPEGTPMIQQVELEQEMWKRATLTEWIQTPLTALGGKTPTEAASIPELQIPLSAALVVVDAYCDRDKHPLNVDEMREHLSLPPIEPLTISPTTSLTTFTAMQLQRLPVEELTDAQVSSTLNRAILIHHCRLLYRVLTNVLKRPECMERVDLNRVYMTLLSLSLESGNREEAIEWTTLGAEHAKTLDKAFEQGLQWAMRELSIRVEDPEDTGVQQLLERFDTYYFPKLPGLQSSIDELLLGHNIVPPWAGREQLATEGIDGGALSGGGIWTPDSGAPAPQSDGAPPKLWTPGQD